jgi:ribosome biogenesis GTPase
MNGMVIKSTGKLYLVRDVEGEKHSCTVKGVYKLKGFDSTNPIAVGDIVDFDVMDGSTGVITFIHDRKNYMIRKSTNLSRQVHIIAANLDLAILIASLHSPRTSPGFIDRFLVTAEAYGIPAMIVFNKTDQLNEELRVSLNEMKRMYESLGYPCLEISALEGENISALFDIIKGKVCLLSGHSGVGKSTIINCLQPSVKRKTAAVSEYHSKGVHTTTFAEMFEMSNGGFIIDTPGIKEFGIVGIEKAEISGFFPEMRELRLQCQFHNCQHASEPGCAIKLAVEEGRIYVSRYNSYLSILFGDDFNKK